MEAFERDTPILLIIAGPTAVGKTDVAINLAKHFDTEIISADSRQIYRELNIGTAKPTSGELAQVNHHFINERSIFERYTVADFEREAIPRLTKLFSEHEIVICAGGTGLYLKSIMHGMDDVPEVDNSVNLALQDLLDKHGLEFLVKELIENDAEYASQGDMENPHRVLRALAVCRATGKPFSTFLNGEPKKRDFKFVNVCLLREREDLYHRITLRVDQMMLDGLEKEARELIPYKNHQALQTVGYRELFDHFEDLHDRHRAVELIKRNSRRYAKRQMTWFRNQGTWNYLDATDLNLCDKLVNLIS